MFHVKHENPISRIKINQYQLGQLSEQKNQLILFQNKADMN